MTSFGRLLYGKRKDKKLTQGAVARRAGVSTSYVSTLEREQHHIITNAPPMPTLEVVDSLAKAVEGDQDEFRSAAGYMPKSLAESDSFELPDGSRILRHGGRKFKNEEERKRFELTLKIAVRQYMEMSEDDYFVSDDE